jgi:hypothetical protein
MNTNFEIAAVAYLFIGALLGTIGPAGRDIAREIESLRGIPLTNTVTGRDPPSELKIFFFRMVITTGFILLWPVFIPGVLRERARIRARKKNFEEKSQGLWLEYNTGGHGTVTCNDCHFSKELTSFIHGRDWCNSGFQCQSCGKLTSIRAGGPGRPRNEYERRLVCACGGDLARDRVVFCPRCKSKNMSYDMEYIT